MNDYLERLACDVLLKENVTVKRGKDQTLDSVLTRLPKQQENCMRMFYNEKLNLKEISTELGITSSQVRYCIQTALRTLRKKENRAVIESCIKEAKTPQTT